MRLFSVKTVAAILGLLPLFSWAGNTAQMNLYGTLIAPPPCYINAPNPIVVDFGDHVGIKKVDGVNYTQPVNFQIVCADDPYDDTAWVLGLTVRGATTAFDNAAVQMQIDGSSSMDLGIKLLLDGKDFPLNQRLELSPGAQPVMQAVPVKTPGSTLPEGHFQGTATLLADYQ